MQRQIESTLHRQRNIDSEDRMIDQGTAEEMVKRVMDQPRGMRSQYTIMQDGAVYQSGEIQVFAQELGLADIPDVPAVDDGTDMFASKN